MTNKEIKNMESGVPSALSEEVYNIAIEMAAVAEEILIPNQKEKQVLTENTKRLLEISKILKEKGL